MSFLRVFLAVLMCPRPLTREVTETAYSRDVCFADTKKFTSTYRFSHGLLASHTSYPIPGLKNIYFQQTSSTRTQLSMKLVVCIIYSTRCIPCMKCKFNIVDLSWVARDAIRCSLHLRMDAKTHIVIKMSFDDVGWSSEGALLNPTTTVSKREVNDGMLQTQGSQRAVITSVSGRGGGKSIGEGGLL